jgi:hypothetical protein
MSIKEYCGACGREEPGRRWESFCDACGGLVGRSEEHERLVQTLSITVANRQAFSVCIGCIAKLGPDFIKKLAVAAHDCHDHELFDALRGLL